jgi:uncharacterized protein
MQKAIADIFTWPSETPQLIGSRCDDCCAVTFPTATRCPRCGKSTMREMPLPRRGTLISWTTQEFPPIVPYAGDATGTAFQPFGVGLVQLENLVRVEARLTESSPARLDFGMDVELQVAPFYTDEEGIEILTFAFAPVTPDQSEEERTGA